MHPLVQGVIAASMLALVGLGGVAFWLWQEDRRAPTAVVQVAPAQTAAERAEESHCNVVRKLDPLGTATALGRRNPDCY